MRNKSVAFKKHLEILTDEYKDEGNNWPATSKDVALWALMNRKLDPTHPTMVRLVSEMFGTTWREQHRTDKQGRSVRAKHSAQLRLGGRFTTVWFDSENAPRELMATAFQNIRRGIVGTIVQATTDIASYNENDNIGAPITWSSDFRSDVAEYMVFRDAIPSEDIRWDDEDEGWDDEE